MIPSFLNFEEKKKTIDIKTDEVKNILFALSLSQDSLT